MSESRHTPGEWFTHTRDDEELGTLVLAHVDGRDDEIVCDCHSWGRIANDQEHANARLIAAAPELLAAVKALEWSGEREWSDGKSGPACPWCDAAQGEDLHLPSCPVGNAIAAAEPQS